MRGSFEVTFGISTSGLPKDALLRLFRAMGFLLFQSLSNPRKVLEICSALKEPSQIDDLAVLVQLASAEAGKILNLEAGGWELEFGIGNSSALSCSFRCSRQAERCFIIQSSSACSKPMSCPAFSLSTHLCRKISSRSAKNSLYSVEFLTNSAASFSDGSICCSAHFWVVNP